MPQVPIPRPHIDALNFTKTEWHLHFVKQDMDQDLALRGSSRLVYHESRGPGRGRPEHEHAAGGIEIALDLLTPDVPAIDVHIPPDSPLPGLQGLGIGPHAFAFDLGVAEEDVGHRACVRVRPSYQTSKMYKYRGMDVYFGMS